MLGGIKVPYVVLEPVHPSQVPNGCLFMDNTNGNAATIKSTGGSNDQVTAAESSFFVSQMVSNEAFAANRPISLADDGGVVDSESDGVGRKNWIGWSVQASTGAGELVNILTPNPRLAGALIGLGFSTGQAIYLSQNKGYTNDPNSFTGNDDRIIRVGIATCPVGVKDTVATDLLGISDTLLDP